MSKIANYKWCKQTLFENGDYVEISHLENGYYEMACKWRNTYQSWKYVTEELAMKHYINQKEWLIYMNVGDKY
jgi:hypothetical protein